MRSITKRGWMAALLVVCIAVAAFAGTTGKITGVVTDKTTGKPIPGAAVSVEGTVLGALTDEDGRYVILNVPVGTYTVKANLVGFTAVQSVNVGVSVDLTTYENFELSEQAVEMAPITVTMQRPLVIQDQTSSLRIVDEQQIQNMPTRGYQDIVGLQAGVVRYNDNPNVRFRGDRENSNTGQINMRGGRASEVAYFVDGFSQQDPLTGLSTSQINNNSIEEVSVVSGGFNAEYGLIMSGAVNITTKGNIQATNYHGSRSPTISTATSTITTSTAARSTDRWSPDTRTSRSTWRASAAGRATVSRTRLRAVSCRTTRQGCGTTRAS